MRRTLEQFDFARPRLVHGLERRRRVLRRCALAVTALLPLAAVYAAAGGGWLPDLVAVCFAAAGPLLVAWEAWDRSVAGRIEVLRDRHRALTGRDLPV